MSASPRRTPRPFARALMTGLTLATIAGDARAQAPTPGDTLVSPLVTADGRVTFQLYAPRATAVTIRTEGPAPFTDRRMEKSTAGVWTASVADVPPDLYIYWYDVDGVPTADPRNPRPRVNLTTVRSLLDVPGAAAAFHADRAVPHGALAQVWYRSSALGIPRRMHVYTPPGYGAGREKYPVLYLLHGSGDDDSAWPTVGRANFILDNLIAEGRAVPMIVVMPAGHVPRQTVQELIAGRDAFARDFLADVVPYVEANYRVRTGPRNRALAGLSMGGLQTLQIGLTHLDTFSQLGVFSGGFFGDGGPQRFAAANQRLLRDRRTNGRIRLFWIATGAEDFVMPATRGTLAMLDEHGIRYTYRETPGGHTWPNWRVYLRDFAPLLFR